jgi:hypothetical protein
MTLAGKPAHVSSNTPAKIRNTHYWFLIYIEQRTEQNTRALVTKSLMSILIILDVACISSFFWRKILTA